MNESVSFRFMGSSRDLRVAASEAERALQGVERQAQSSARGIERSMGRAERSTRSAFSGIGGAIAGISARAVAGLGVIGAAGGGLAIGLGINFNRIKEQAEIAFTTMLGSGQKARAFLDDLKEFARTTPFEFPELIRTSQRLLAMGFAADEVIPSLTAIGDAVSALGASEETLNRVTLALGQMQLKGRVQAEEMLQLIEAGVNGWQYLADAMGTSVVRAQEMVTKRQVEGRFAVRAILAGMERDFEDSMQLQSRTFAGLWSTIKDTASQTLGTALGPVFDVLRDQMQRLVDASDDPRFGAAAQRFGQILATEIIPRVGQLLSFLWANRDAAIEFATRAGGAIVDLSRLVWQLVGVLDSVVDVMGGWDEAFYLLLGGIIARQVLILSRSIISSLIPTIVLVGTTWTQAAATSGRAMAAMRVAAVLTSRVIRTALITTGIGALVVAASLAAEQIINHWGAIVDWLQQTFIPTLHRLALRAAALFLEPFSHLPGRFGQWARDAKVAVNNELDILVANAAAKGAATGSAWGANFLGSATPFVSALTGSVTGAGAGGLGLPGQTGPGSLSFRPGVNRNINPIVLQQAKNVSSIVGSELSVLSGRRPGSTVAGTNRVSNHSAGNAVDLGPYYGATLIKVGQAALVAAGMPPAQAAKITTHYGTVNGWEVIFNCNPCGGNHKDHVHIGSKAPAPVRTPPTPKLPKIDLPPAAIDVPDFTPLTTPTNLTTGKKGKSAEEIRDEREATFRATRGLAAIRRSVETVLSPQLRAKLRQQAADLGKAIADGLKGDDAERKVEGLKDRLAKALELNEPIRKAREAVATIRERLARFPDDLQAELGPKLDAINRQIAKIVTPDMAAKVSAELDQITSAIDARLDRMRDVVNEKRGGMIGAFNRVMELALRAFDRQTQQILRNVESNVAALHGIVGGRGPARRQIEALREARERQQEQKRLAEMQAEIAAETDPVRQAELMRQLAEEQESLAFEATIRGLEREADAQEQAYQEDLERERQRVQDERDITRERFQARYDEIVRGIENETITVEDGQKQIQDLLLEYGMTDVTIASTMGSLFADEWQKSMNKATAATLELVKALDALVRATGGARVDPNARAKIVQWIDALTGNVSVRVGTQGGTALTNAEGGIVPGFDPGFDSRMAFVKPGELILNKAQQRNIAAQLVGARGGGGASFDGATIYVLGTSEREVSIALRRLVEAAPEPSTYLLPR